MKWLRGVLTRGVGFNHVLHVLMEIKNIYIHIYIYIVLYVLDQNCIHKNGDEVTILL